jgi:hypothetical protein
MTADAVDAGELTQAEPRRRGLRLPTLARTDSDFDIRNTWQIVAGALLMPFGVIVILLAWHGAAHARVEQQQIPYMVSGGFIGLGLMIAGGLLFWAHWLYRIYDQADLQHQELIEAINRLSVGSGDGGGNGVSAGPAPERATRSSARGAQYVATATGSNFHRANCSVVAGRRGLRKISASDAASMQPCRICEPLVHA